MWRVSRTSGSECPRRWRCCHCWSSWSRCWPTCGPYASTPARTVAVDEPGDGTFREGADVSRDPAVTELLPRGLRRGLVAGLLGLVLVPVLYIGFASVNSDLAVASGAFLPTSLNLGNYLRVWST